MEENNIVRCDGCGLDLIFEEIDIHDCNIGDRQHEEDLMDAWIMSLWSFNKVYVTDNDLLF